MKKLVLLLSIIFSLVIVVTACNDKKGQGTTSNTLSVSNGVSSILSTQTSSLQTMPNSNTQLPNSSANMPLRFIYLQTIGQGKINISKTTGYAGEMVYLSAMPDIGYVVESISLYGYTFENLNVSGEYKYPFIMQDVDTTIIVKFSQKQSQSTGSTSSIINSANSSDNLSYNESLSSVSTISGLSSIVSSSSISNSSLENTSSNSNVATNASSNTSASISNSSNISANISSNTSSIVNSNSSSNSSGNNSGEQGGEVVTPPVQEETDNVLPTLSTIDTGVSNIGDPYILADPQSNKYYMYATSTSDSGFKVWESEDLKNWTDKGNCYKETNYGTNRTPFEADYWAPEVVYNPRSNCYIMYFSATERNKGVKKIGVATSNSPLGPFIHTQGATAMFDAGKTNVAYIDAHFFLDDDNQAYLLYCNDCSKNVVNGVNTSQVWIRKLSEDWTKVEGAGQMISTPTQSWETQEDSQSKNTQWNEAPALYKHNGKYHLMYSANPYWNPLYGVGCAVADNIWGEYIKYDWNPILVKVEGATSGPGHNMLFKDFDGNLWASYHRHTNNSNPNGDRTAMLSPAWFDNGILKIEYGQKYDEETVHEDTNEKKEVIEVDLTKESPKTTIYTNITNIGDPFVLADQNSKKYYMYATSISNGYKVWESTDLVNWTDMGECFTTNISNTFGYQDFWAPEVVYNETTRKYIMYYTARYTPISQMQNVVEDGSVAGNYNEAYNTGVLKTGVAVSESPLGPFIDCTGYPMFDLGLYVATIDASLFVDDDGQGYLYYSRDCSQNVVNGVHTSQTWVVKVDNTWTRTIGEHYLVTTPDTDWELKSGENGGYLWNEGPFVLKYNNKYYLTYSANLFSTNDYSVGLAISDKPMQDFIKSNNNPIITSIKGKMTGPGHCMFFYDFDGYLWCCYHIQTNMNNPSGNRKMALSGAWFNNGELVVEYKK